MISDSSTIIVKLISFVYIIKCTSTYNCHASWSISLYVHTELALILLECDFTIQQLSLQLLFFVFTKLHISAGVSFGEDSV